MSLDSYLVVCLLDLCVLHERDKISTPTPPLAIVAATPAARASTAATTTTATAMTMMMMSVVMLSSNRTLEMQHSVLSAIPFYEI